MSNTNVKTNPLVVPPELRPEARPASRVFTPLGTATAHSVPVRRRNQPTKVLAGVPLLEQIKERGIALKAQGADEARLEALRALYRAVQRARPALVQGRRVNFTQARCTQHVGQVPERTCSDYLDTLDHVRENAVAAALKGHLAFHYQRTVTDWGFVTTTKVSRPVFVQADLAPNESAWHTFDDEPEDTGPRESRFMFDGRNLTYSEHAKALRVLFSDDYLERQRQMIRLDAFAAMHGARVDGGRSVMGLVRKSSVEHGSYVVVERLALGSNESEPTSLQDVNLKEDEDPFREAADTDEWHAGTGLRKGHSHTHGLVTVDELRAQEQAEKRAAGDRALELLRWIRPENLERPAPMFVRVPVPGEDEPVGWPVHVGRKPRKTFDATVYAYVAPRIDGSPCSRTQIKRMGRALASSPRPHTLDVAMRLEQLRHAWAACDPKAGARQRGWLGSVLRRIDSWTWTEVPADGQPLIATRVEADPYIEERGAFDGVFIDADEDALLLG